MEGPPAHRVRPIPHSFFTQSTLRVIDSFRTGQVRIFLAFFQIFFDEIKNRYFNSFCDIGFHFFK